MDIKTIYCDMDGVLTDFVKGAQKADAINGKVVDWKKINKLGSAFWAELEWTKDGQQFINWLRKLCTESKIDLCILSSVGREEGVKGKQMWLDEKTPFISKQNRYFVKRGSDKGKYASRSSILIDDFGKNIEAFIMAGGQAVKYENFNQARDEITGLL